MLQKDDVPYGDDWDSAAVVAGWAKVADQKRPWRSQIRDHIAGIVATLPQRARVLELGSGPGFLAHRVLDRCPSIEGYTLLDFSEHMLGLSRERLVAFPAATFVLGSFKSEDWTRHVEGRFDCVLAMQSVHELHGTSGTQHDCTNRSTKFSPFLDSSRSVTTFPSTTRRRAPHSI